MFRKNSVLLVFTVAVIFFIIPCLGHHLFPQSNFTLIRNRRQSNNCRRQFQCDNNNECVHYKKVCNGQKDCTDGSDEDPTICNDTPVEPAQTISSNTSCPFPKINNGQMTVLGEGHRQGEPIPNYAFASISCTARFKLIPPTNNVGCINGAWNVPLPECVATCTPIFPTDLFEVDCLIDDKPINCSEPLLHGTVAISRCKSSNKDFSISLCSKGFWDTPPIRCPPECGKALPDKGTELIGNDPSAKIGKFPWHVGIYRLKNNDYQYQCGGTIISPLIIVTVAHCFTDPSGNQNQAEEYFVGAGKYYSNYMKSQEKFAQKRQVKEYYIPSQFKGFQSNFAADVAVVIVKAPFEISIAVSPVCLDWTVNQIEPNSPGSVAGWTIKDSNDEIRTMQTNYIDEKRCADEVSAEFRRFVTSDKFCSTNDSEICKGYSGSGIYFEKGQKYYLRGVLSVAEKLDDICGRSYGVYTDLKSHSSFIQNEVERNTVKDKNKEVTCPLRISNSVIVNCTLNGEHVDCSKPVADGTIAISKCKTFYVSSQGEQSISTCSKGSWDKPLIECETECGDVIPDGEIYITEGQKAKRGKFPWHVGIYHLENGEYKYQCGGSIISPTIILSVAHCFLDHEGKDRFPAEEFYVASGKYLSDFNATEALAQRRRVYKFYTPPEYKGIASFLAGDLSVVELSEPLEMTNVVRPVCVDWNKSTDIKPNDLGVLVGWGFDETGQISTDLKQLNVPYVDSNICMQVAPPGFYNFMTPDKICAGYTNGSSICKGDSGNGLIFEKNLVNNKEKYYIGGIASVAASKQGTPCGSDQYALYTKISSYIDFIKDVISKSPDRKPTCSPILSDSVDVRCTLDGKLVDCWQAVDGTIAITKCKDSYTSKLNRNLSISRCTQGSWDKPFIRCVQVKPLQTDTCTPRISESVNVKCISDDKPVNCNKRMKEGTVVISECKDFYVPVQGAISIAVSRCSQGSWTYPLIQCKPLQPLKLECGEVSPDGETYAVNASTAKRGEFPWHVGLYRLLNEQHVYKCGGSIITSLVVLTAAHCFTTQYGERYPAEEFYVGAGKYYSDYYAKEDAQAQKLQVKEYHTPPIYRGYETNFQGDLAVVVMIKAFEMTNVVQPVCIEWGNKIELQQLQPSKRGNVVGWGTVNPYDASTASKELKQLSAPYIDVQQCLENVPKNFRRWVTTDKFCAGYTNGSSVCKGDSGGGMVFEWNGENEHKYYIRGVVSVGPQDKAKSLVCDNYKYGAYTKISSYSSFILNILNKYR